MKELIVDNNIIQLDDDVYELFKEYKWVMCSGYARGFGPLGGKYMHQLIMNVPCGLGVDHRDGNKLNNTRDNLRIATMSQNIQNTLPRNQLGMKGVHQNKATGRFFARGHKDWKKICLGTYDTPIEAAKAYDKWALEVYGEEALTNKKLGMYV